MTAGQRFGNQYLYMMLSARQLQAKLTLSDPSDAFEHEADRVAEQVMRMPEPAPPVHGPIVQSRTADALSDLNRACGCDGEAAAVDDATETTIRGLSSRGMLLPESVRSFMEPRFNTDFSGVRVHTDALAHELARAVSAQAFTVGHDIVFGTGHYAPNTETGQRLLAHELTHVVQQRGHGANHAVQRKPQPFSRFEAAAPEDMELKIVDIKDIQAHVARALAAPGPAQATGRAEYRANPEGAMASLYNAHFRNDDERLSYAVGVLREFLGGERSDRDELFAYLSNYEQTFQQQASDLVVHSPPTEAEAKRLGELRGGVKQRAEQRRARERDAELSKLKHVDSEVRPEELSPLSPVEDQRQTLDVNWYVEMEPASPIIAAGTKVSFHLRNGQGLEVARWAELAAGAGPHPLFILSDADGHFSLARTTTVKPYHSAYRTTLDKPGKYRATFLGRPVEAGHGSSTHTSEVRVSVDFQVLSDLSPDRVSASLGDTASSDLEHLKSSKTSEGEIAAAFQRIAVRRAFEALEANRQEALAQLALYTQGGDGRTAQQATSELESIVELDFMLQAEDARILSDPERANMTLTHEQQLQRVERERAQRQAIVNARATLVEAFPALAIVNRHGESRWMFHTSQNERLKAVQSGLRQVLADIDTVKHQLATGDLSIMRAAPILAQTRQALGIDAEPTAKRAVDRLIDQYGKAEEVRDAKIGAASLLLLLLPGIGPYLAATVGIGFAARSWMRVGELKAGAGAGVREGIVDRADLEAATFWASLDTVFAALDLAGAAAHSLSVAKKVAPHVRPPATPLAERAAKTTASEVHLAEAERPHAPAPANGAKGGDREIRVQDLGGGQAKLLDLPTMEVTLGRGTHTLMFGRRGERVGAMLCSKCGFIVDKASAMLRELDKGHPLARDLREVRRTAREIDAWATEAIRLGGEEAAEARQRIAKLAELLTEIERRYPPDLLDKLLPDTPAFGTKTRVEPFPLGGSAEARGGSRIRTSESEPEILGGHIPDKGHAPVRAPHDEPSIIVDESLPHEQLLPPVVEQVRKQVSDYLGAQGARRGVPAGLEHVSPECMGGACGLSRMYVARELTNLGIPGSKIFLNQVRDLAHTGQHTFTILEIAQNRYILIDTTFAQFTGLLNGAPRAGERILRKSGRIGAQIRDALMEHGFLELNDEIVNVYVKVVSELDGGSYTVSDLVRESTSLARNPRLLNIVP